MHSIIEFVHTNRIARFVGHEQYDVPIITSPGSTAHRKVVVRSPPVEHEPYDIHVTTFGSLDHRIVEVVGPVFEHQAGENQVPPLDCPLQPGIGIVVETPETHECSRPVRRSRGKITLGKPCGHTG